MPTAPFGTWPSPLTTDVITEKTISIAEVIVDASNGSIYHVEERPHEGGRRVLVHSESSRDVFGTGWNARTGVHEYGGSAAAVYNDTALFTDWNSKRVYVCAKSGDGWDEPKPVTPDNPNHRFGEFNIHPTLAHLVVCILEDHTKPAPADVVNSLVLLDLKAQTVTTLAEGADFYAFGRFSPDGTKLAWIQWWHPDMPWEGSELYVASLNLTSDSLSISGTPKHIAGARTTEATTQPTWSSSTKLIFLSDKSGFFNHYVHDTSTDTTKPALGKFIDQDFADPAWILGGSNYAVLKEDTILAPGTVDGQNGFLVIDSYGQRYSFCSCPYVSTSQVRAIPSGAGAGASAVFVGAGDDKPPTLVRMALLLGKPRYDVLKETTTAPGLPALQGFAFSKAQPMTFQVQTQSGSTQPLHVNSCAPMNKDFTGSKREEPPFVVDVHADPTASAPPGLKWLFQYWASRSWVWGTVVNTDDCVTTVLELEKAGLVDPKCVAIRGGLAGGFTVLAAAVKWTVHAAGKS